MADVVGKTRKFIVSLQVGGFFFALANVICVAILAHTYLTLKQEPKTIEVKGSARRAITSDAVAWSGSYVARDPDLTKAYDKLKGDADKIAAFLTAAGIAKEEITFSSIRTEKTYQREVVPAAPVAQPPGTPVVAQPPVILTTNKVEFYTLYQSVSVESKDMKKVPEVARNITSLIKDGIEIDSGSAMYLYTKLSELKIDMLAEATKDATTRATQIVSNANGKLGKLVDAKMGVMQVNPKGSTATSAEGNNDTTSLEKEIMSVVTTRFEVN